MEIGVSDILVVVEDENYVHEGVVVAAEGAVVEYVAHFVGILAARWFVVDAVVVERVVVFGVVRIVQVVVAVVFVHYYFVDMFVVVQHFVVVFGLSFVQTAAAGT